MNEKFNYFINGDKEGLCTINEQAKYVMDYSKISGNN